MSYLFLTVFLVFEIGIVVVSIVAGVKVITKAGYSGWWFLITFVPLVGFVMFLVFAFSKWPIQERLDAAERSNRQSGGRNGLYGWGPTPTWGGPRGPEGPVGPRAWDLLH
jgi:ABC-type transport system involved in Fe-S cluster assembly fused permease/ATPase subunit